MKRLILICTALLAWPAWAQEDAMKDLPGYVDFGQLSAVFGEPRVQIAVGQSLLNMVGALSANEDPESAELLKRLKGVRIHVFEHSEMSAGAIDYVNDASGKLTAMGWESVVMVNSDDEQMRVFMKINNDMIEGITVMAVEEDEAAFINVIGNISPAELERVMDNFNVDFDGDDLSNDAG